MSDDPHDLTIKFSFEGKEGKIAGEKGDLDIANGTYVQRYQVDQELGMPDYFSVQLQMKEGPDIILLDKVKPGIEVELKVGYHNEATIFKGEVSYIEAHFGNKTDCVIVSGYHHSHRLMRGTHSKSWGDGHEVNQNFGTVAGSVVNDSKTGKGDTSDALSAKASATDSKSAYIAQYNQTHADFISGIAGNFGIDWASNSQVDAKTLTLKPTEKGSPALKISREKPAPYVLALSADFRISTTKQVSKVVVRSWDVNEKKLIKGEATSVSPIIGGVAGYEQVGKGHHGAGASGRMIEIVDVPVASVAEATEMAKGIMGKLSMDWMTADVSITGDTSVFAGATVEMEGFGKRRDGPYIVTGCKHVFIAGSGTPYTTYLKLARNGSPEP